MHYLRGRQQCSWVSIRALDVQRREELQAISLSGVVRCWGWGVHTNSNAFAVLKNTNTQLKNSLYCYSKDWFDGTTSDELEETLE